MHLTEEARLALLSAIVDSSDDAIISKDLNSIITSWNKSAERLFGYTAEEALGQPITILIPPDRLSEEPHIISRLKNGERVDHFETVRRRKDGTLLDISLAISPVRDSTGKIIGASKIARDITESKRLLLDLQRTNQMLEQFAYSASHDMQEPLRSVKIFSQLLMRKYGSQLDPEGKRMLDFLQRGAGRMETLLQDLLEYTRLIEFEKPTEETDANLALESALQRLNDTISESNAKITTGVLPSLRVHFAHLQQLFQNLIGNALKYRDPNRAPTISINAIRQDAHWLFSIQDNGIGIAPEFAETIFGLFKRLHTGDQYPGTGLGLAICRRIVEQYGGRIWIESQPSPGTLFYFTL